MVTVRAINQVVQCSESMLGLLRENMTEVLESESEKELAQIAKELSVQQEALLKATKSKQPYGDIADAIDELRERKQKALTGKAMQEGQKLRIQELTDFLTGLGQELKEYDEQMVRRYIERITVRENCYEVAFKAGIKIEIEKQ